MTTGNGLLRRIRETPFFRVMWILPIAYAIHEAEEWNILAWYQAHWAGADALTNRTVRTHLVLTALQSFVITGLVAAVAVRWQRVAAFLLVFWFSRPFMFTIPHVYFVPLFGVYDPGLATSLLVLAPAYLFVATRAVREFRVPVWFIALSCAVQIPLMIGPLKAAGSELPGWFDTAERVAGYLFGAP